MEPLSFNAVETLIGFGAGCGAGYGFAMRVLVPALIAAKVAPLEVRQEHLEQEIERLQELNLKLQSKVFGDEETTPEA